MNSRGDLIRAAGGVVWDGEPWKSRLAVVFRSRYGDRCLPKGKLQEGESFEQAAVREIREETGCCVALHDYAGTVRYDVDSRPKVVCYWHATIEGESGFQPGEEVERVDWMTIDEALQHLDYDDERKLLIRSTAIDVTTPRPGWMCRFLMRPHCLDVERLAGEIADAGSRQQTDAPGNTEIRRLLDCARDALDKRNLSLGWDHVRRIRELMIATMDVPHLQAEAIQLRNEATAKIDKGREGKDAWRQQSILKLLEPIQNEATDSKDMKTPSKDMKMRLEYALRLRAGYFDGMHFKNRRWQYATNVVCLVMFVVVVALFILFSLGSLGAVATHNGSGGIEDAMVVATVVCFGVLGASFSTLRALTSGAARYTEIRIPQQFLDLSTSLRRLFIGGGAALVAYLLVLRTADIDTTPFLYLAAFAAGFSDNLVEKGMEAVQKRSGGV